MKSKTGVKSTEPDQNRNAFKMLGSTLEQFQLVAARTASIHEQLIKCSARTLPVPPFGSLDVSFSRRAVGTDGCGAGAANGTAPTFPGTA